VVTEAIMWFLMGNCNLVALRGPTATMETPSPIIAPCSSILLGHNIISHESYGEQGPDLGYRHKRHGREQKKWRCELLNQCDLRRGQKGDHQRNVPTK
jgi:hypothetical protein